MTPLPTSKPFKFNTNFNSTRNATKESDRWKFNENGNSFSMREWLTGIRSRRGVVLQRLMVVMVRTVQRTPYVYICTSSTSTSSSSYPYVIELIDAKNKEKPGKRGKNILYFYADSQYYFWWKIISLFLDFVWGNWRFFITLHFVWILYTLCLCMDTSFYKIWIIQWMKNLWILNDWWIYKHYFYYWRGNFNFSLCFFFLLFFFISSLYICIYTLLL